MDEAGHGSPADWDDPGIPAVDRVPGLHLPDWFQTLGRGAWLLVGIAVLLAIVFLLLGLVSDLVIPLVFSAILAAIFVPLVDRLERWRLPRWLGAPLVVLLVIGVVSVIVWMVVAGLVGQGREILAQVTAGLEETGSLPGIVDLDAEQAIRTLGELVQTLVSGLLSGLGSVTVLIVGIVTGLFILLFLMKDWRLVVDWTASQIAALLGLPDGMGGQIVADTVHSFRGYALGLTIVGLMNGLVVGLGALLLGVPLAGPIAIVTFATSYIPFFGAFFAGAFAVVIALGAKGLSVALAMLAITLLANNTLQNLLEPVAFGRTLRLHPLVVLLVTTAGTLLFGVLGATLAAPVTAVTLRTIGLLRDAGLFGMAATPSAAAGELPPSQEGRETSAGPILAE
ncbi:MAG TPA: AI-2E family transporter [Actinomycetes bacterium]|nr:AI-2E family transporter [Actinomycetes bacterium]